MLDINKPVVNPVLIKAMDAFLKEQNPRTELDMISAIEQAHLLAPVLFSEPPEDGVLKEGTTIQYYLITNSKEEQFFLAFTDWAQLGKWAKEEKRDAIVSNSREYTAMLEHSESAKGVVINPYDQNITLTSEMLKNFPKRKEMLIKMVPPRFMIGKPKEEPVDLQEALAKYFKKKQKDIQEAWLFLALREGTVKPRYMLIVDFEGDPEDAKAMFPSIGECAKPYLKDDEGLDIVRRDEQFAKDMIEKNEPFYRKKAGLFW